MRYQSTRSNITADSINAVLTGIAPDGGLFVDPSIADRALDVRSVLDSDTKTMASMILSVLLDDYRNMKDLVMRAYDNKFETEDLTPLVKVGDNYVLELFRGPTSAFKDVALSMLPVLISEGRAQSGMKEETVILTATSGDTGKAALEGFHDVDGTKIIVFYPHNGVSAVQKAQMATQEGSNVRVCAVRGNFDDCQRGVKTAFAELTEKLEGSTKRLSSANSINIGRLAPQVVYYFASYRDLLKEGRISMGDKVDFIVPTGNFGDILAGYYAKLLGLPVGKLVCAANINNVLTDFINTGLYDRKRPFHKTQSPSMDILVSSNLERLLFLASAKDCAKVASWMRDLNETGQFKVDEKTLAAIQDSFASYYCSEEDMTLAIKQCWEENHYLCDPHTAVAWAVSSIYKKESETENPVVVLSTASPYKFPTAVLQAIGGLEDESEFDQMRTLSRITGIPVPKNLSSLEGKKERFCDVINSDEIVSYVTACLENWE